MDHQKDQYTSLHHWLNDPSTKLEASEDHHLASILSKVSELSVPTNKDTDEAWAELSQRMAANTLRKKQQNQRWVLGVAASLALLITFAWLLSGQDRISVLAADQVVAHTLPDGSKVLLNKDSEISYDAAIWPDQRELTLRGEAFFEVEKGSNFLVKTTQGEVQTIGTSFDVYQRGDVFDVAVFTGKVKVIRANESKILPALQKLSLTNGMLGSLNPVSQDEYQGWQDGTYKFEDEKLSIVLAELERQYKVVFKGLDKVKDERIKIMFKTSYELKDILAAIAEAKSLSFETQGSNITIKSE